MLIQPRAVLEHRLRTEEKREHSFEEVTYLETVLDLKKTKQLKNI